MQYLIAIILGIVEGATEFIPISSTGHLIIVRQLLGANSAGGLAFDAVLQLAASCALLVYFWKDVAHMARTVLAMVKGKVLEQKDKVVIWAIVLGTIPAVIFGLVLEKDMETIFRNSSLVALMLILGSFLMAFAEKKSKENKILTWGRGVVIGLFQSLALVPGISRSGATISGGLLTGLSKNEAVRFSFLLSLPILFGSGFKKLFDVRHELLSTSFGLPLFLGSLAAFIVGLISINFLIKYLRNHSLKIFVWYRIVLAVLILILI